MCNEATERSVPVIGCHEAQCVFFGVKIKVKATRGNNN